MRRVNLLPPEERRRALAVPGGFEAGAPAVLLVLGAAVLFLLVLLYLVLLLRLNGAEAEISDLNAEVEARNERLRELGPYEDLRARLDAKKPVADGIFRTRFPWDEFLQGLAYVIPETTALESLSAQAAPVDVEAPVEAPLDPPGAITFQGIALPRYTNVADFVVRMNNLRYLANSQLNEAELDREDFASPAIGFEVAAELVTVAGENGTEVRLEGIPTGGAVTPPAEGGAPAGAGATAGATAEEGTTVEEGTTAGAGVGASASAGAGAEAGRGDERGRGGRGDGARGRGGRGRGAR